MTVAINHKHMTVMHMESALPVFKLNGSEMAALRVFRNATVTGRELSLGTRPCFKLVWRNVF